MVRSRLRVCPDGVTADLPATVATTGGVPYRSVITVEYTCGDPYALVVVVPQAQGQVQGQARSWMVARELVADAVRTRTPVGLGEVSVWAPRWRRAARIRLSDNAGPTAVTVSRPGLRALLRHVNRLVEPGKEGRYLRLDAELDALLDIRPDR